MRTLYIDCGMGAAGDMLTAAMLELLQDKEEFLKELNGMGLPGVVFKAEPSVKCGITGTHVIVTVDGAEEESHDHHHGDEHSHSYEHTHSDEHTHSHDHSHHHHHSSLHDIEHIVRGHLKLSMKVQDDVMAVYGLIAEAESYVHGVPVTEIHFHEVGAMDAIADITAVCMLMERLSVDEVVVSPVHVGSGQVRCTHGILPVPAPATAYILRAVPIYGGSVRGELCTPTGAALLKHFAARFGNMPMMKAVSSIELGMDTLTHKPFEELTDDEIVAHLHVQDAERVFCVYEALKRGIDHQTIWNITKIDWWFLDKMQHLANLEKGLAKCNGTLSVEQYKEAKKYGFQDKTIKRLVQVDKLPVENYRAGFKMVDTCAAEFSANTPYFYSTYDGDNEAAEFIAAREAEAAANGQPKKKKVLVFGSGPIRIGQGIEFDYCSVHCLSLIHI